MAEKKTQTGKSAKSALAGKLRDLDVLDEKVTKVKGGAAKKRRSKRDLP